MSEIEFQADDVFWVLPGVTNPVGERPVLGRGLVVDDEPEGIRRGLVECSDGGGRWPFSLSEASTTYSKASTPVDLLQVKSQEGQPNPIVSTRPNVLKSCRPWASPARRRLQVVVISTGLHRRSLTKPSIRHSVIASFGHGES